MKNVESHLQLLLDIFLAAQKIGKPTLQLPNNECPHSHGLFPFVTVAFLDEFVVKYFVLDVNTHFESKGEGSIHS